MEKRLPVLTLVPVLRMQGAEEPSRAPKMLFAFNSRNDIDEVAMGCDADIGGSSTVHFDLDESTASNEKAVSFLGRPSGRFWGNMRLSVQQQMKDKVRGGYAGFRSKARPHVSVCKDSSIDLPGLAAVDLLRRVDR